MPWLVRLLLGLSAVLFLLAGILFWISAGRPEPNPAAEPPPRDTLAVETAPHDTTRTDPPPAASSPDTTQSVPDSTQPEQVRPPAVEQPEPRPSGLIIPVAGIEPEALIDTFEEARSQSRSHDAIDIIAPLGTPVLAADDGRIVRLFTSEHGGLTIYQLAPDDRTVYYYAHLDGYAEGLAADDTVRQGDVLGYVGDTGNAVPGNYHLHFAIWITDDPDDFWDGQPVNPYPLLRGED